MYNDNPPSPPQNQFRILFRLNMNFSTYAGSRDWAKIDFFDIVMSLYANLGHF